MDVLIYTITGAVAGLLAMSIATRLGLNNTRSSLWVVIVTVAGLGLTREFIAPFYLAGTYEHNLKRQDPAMRIIARQFPNEFHDYIDEAKRKLIKYKEDTTLFNEKLLFLHKLSRQMLPKASNQSIYAFYQASLSLDIALFGTAPELVLYLEYSDQYQNKPKPSLILLIAGKPLVTNVIIALETMIVSAIENPQPLLTETERKRASELIFQTVVSVSKEFGADNLSSFLQDPDNPALNSKVGALIVMSFAKNILDHGPDDTGIAYKYLFQRAAQTEHQAGG
jgi:hypothetical protein